MASQTPNATCSAAVHHRHTLCRGGSGARCPRARNRALRRTRVVGRGRVCCRSPLSPAAEEKLTSGVFAGIGHQPVTRDLRPGLRTRTSLPPTRRRHSNDANRPVSKIRTKGIRRLSHRVAATTWLEFVQARVPVSPHLAAKGSRAAPSETGAAPLRLPNGASAVSANRPKRHDSTAATSYSWMCRRFFADGSAVTSKTPVSPGDATFFYVTAATWSAM